MFCPTYRPLFLKDGSKLRSFNPLTVIYIEADDNYAHVITTSGKQCIRSTMKDIEASAIHDFFCRVHRSYIVNIQYVKCIEKGLINLDSADVPLHKDYAASFFKKIFHVSS